jgi:hypothetical protein
MHNEPQSRVTKRPGELGGLLPDALGSGGACLSGSRRDAFGDDDSLCLPAPRHERERLPGGPIEPRRIIDSAHKRTTRLGRPGQRAQDRKRHREVFWGAAVL